jgi:hypothetical protein
VESLSDSATDDEVNVDRPQTSYRKGKRKAGERVEWSADEDDDAYAIFKNRAATKRKKVAVTKKKIKEKAKSKESAIGRQKSNISGQSSSTKDKIWGEGHDSDLELMEEEIPDYLRSRRKKFESRKAKLKQGK